MANNRMFLVFRPTGKAVYLGKRMEWGWYGVPADLPASLQALFDYTKSDIKDHPWSQDDFAVAMEGADGDPPYVVTDWIYGPRTEEVLINLKLTS